MALKSIEATGKTVKDAIERGAAQLGCTQDDLDIQIIEMGSTGIFGLFGKPAKVRLTVKEKDDDIDVAAMLNKQPAQKQKKEKPVQQPKPQPKKKAEEPKSVEAAKTEETEVPEAFEAAEEETTEAAGEAAPKHKRRRRRKPKSERAAQENTSDTEETEAAAETPVPVIEAEPFVETPEDQLSEYAVKARAFLMELTEKMGVPMTCVVCETEGQIRIVMSGENMSILIGRRGETLDSLQYLTSLVVNRGHDDYIRVSLDTENYRAKREEALRKLAIRMANRCKKSGRRVAMEPMNPYERRILHSALQADPEVTTHSEGEEPYRRVIITLK